MSQRYCKFNRVLWACPAKNIKNNNINFYKIFMFISMHNINFSTQFFLEIFKGHSALVVLNTLGMPGHTHQQCHSKIAMKTIEMFMFWSYMKDGVKNRIWNLQMFYSSHNSGVIPIHCRLSNFKFRFAAKNVLSRRLPFIFNIFLLVSAEYDASFLRY